MSHEKLEEVLKRGIYGAGEVKPEERKLFLGTISERVYLALTNAQVRKKGMYPEVEKLLKTKKGIRLYINGTLNYPSYSNYVQSANKNSVQFTIVSDGQDSPLGVVIAAEQAIDNQGDIFIKDDAFDYDME
ncbi:YueI family protein [Bacillus shivajii]|uniref:YueI family protein n=1 Tax=Bacillus shivajii TaxID=1983719 RepID=UPI001CF99087|nr:YueI family protein [Bacillus shivajii]UCZ54558.1 YueI family protein [Bacillus shivajii]